MHRGWQHRAGAGAEPPSLGGWPEFGTISDAHTQLQVLGAVHAGEGSAGGSRARTARGAIEAHPMVPSLAGELGAQLLPQLPPQHPTQPGEIGRAKLQVCSTRQQQGTTLAAGGVPRAENGGALKGWRGVGSMHGAA